MQDMIPISQLRHEVAPAKLDGRSRRITDRHLGIIQLPAAGQVWTSCENAPVSSRTDNNLTTIRSSVHLSSFGRPPRPSNFPPQNRGKNFATIPERQTLSFLKTKLTAFGGQFIFNLQSLKMSGPPLASNNTNQNRNHFYCHTKSILIDQKKFVKQKSTR
jgi:hypothetical protein